MKYSFSFIVPIAATLALTSCGHVMTSGTDTRSSMITPAELAASNQDTPTSSLNSVREIFDANSENIPTLTAVGYAVVSSQPGQSDAQRRLMAIRSARMAAMRDLAEQIHGLQVDSSTTVIDLMVQNDTFRGIVSGTIRGARTVRINPTGSDTYEIVLEIDREMINYLIDTGRRVV
ncbi:LPP20 family lipoprotein [Alphaproteobacteria bacterium]|jgi:hypothetical protein|nr:LPP20 family lipoprotein [Alphaproteobacteria bacterium]